MCLCAFQWKYFEYEYFTYICLYCKFNNNKSLITHRNIIWSKTRCSCELIYMLQRPYSYTPTYYQSLSSQLQIQICIYCYYRVACGLNKMFHITVPTSFFSASNCIFAWATAESLEAKDCALAWSIITFSCCTCCDSAMAIWRRKKVWKMVIKCLVVWIVPELTTNSKLIKPVMWKICQGKYRFHVRLRISELLLCTMTFCLTMVETSYEICFIRI